MKPEEFEELMFLWKEYGQEKMSNLTSGARLLKFEVMAFIASLPELPQSLVNQVMEKSYLDPNREGKQT
jgi:hypothetical protein